MHSEILGVPEHLLETGVPTKKHTPLNKLCARDEFGGVKYYNPNTREMGYMGPAAVQEIKKAKIQPTTETTTYLVGPGGFVKPINVLNNPDEIGAMQDIAEEYRNIISP